MDKCLIIFTKKPQLGKVKTRLAADIGDHHACAVYKRLLQHSAKQINALNNVKILVFWGNEIPEEKKPFEQHDFHALQVDGDLGERMKDAFETAFKLGAQRVIGMGCDCLDLKTEHLQNAFEALHMTDTVFGPATDGGYYLFGMKKLYPALFENMPWSTDTLLESSLRVLEEEKKSYFLLSSLSDIDYFKDLPKSWQDEYGNDNN